MLVGYASGITTGLELLKMEVDGCRIHNLPPAQKVQTTYRLILMIHCYLPQHEIFWYHKIVLSLSILYIALDLKMHFSDVSDLCNDREICPQNNIFTGYY